MVRFACYRGALTCIEAPARHADRWHYHDLQDRSWAWLAKAMTR
jgi:hypothetical protein